MSTYCDGPDRDPLTGVWECRHQPLEPTEEDCDRCRVDVEYLEELQSDLAREGRQ